MNNRIEGKISEIENFIEFLIERMPKSSEEYKINLEKKAFCERYVEKIAEAVVDLAFLIFKEELVKDKNIKIPQSDSEVFEILRDKSIITLELCKNLVEFKGMRNWLAHKYGEINDKIIFNAISEELPKDIKEFLDAADEYRKKPKEIKWTSVS